MIGEDLGLPVDRFGKLSTRTSEIRACSATFSLFKRPA